MKTYQYIKNGSTTAIYINSDNHTLKLLYELDTTSGTYPGITVDNSYTDTIKHFTRLYPKFWECEQPIEVLKYLSEYGFEQTQVKRWQLLVNS